MQLQRDGRHGHLDASAQLGADQHERHITDSRRPLSLAARASRTREEHAIVLSIAGQIVRGHPAEIVLNVAALSTSPPESLRAIAALHWTLIYALAGVHEDTDRLGF